jgi:3D (Asp-Asp-Asp) domain-containing protein
MEMESIGWYYITAYCPYECGYNGENFPAGWRTASGEICHRADWEDRYIEPTTCAIDRNYHSFGDYFYIEEFDRVFVAEDTGSAVKGKHIDLFYDDESVEGFPTGYYEVFAVEYYEETILLGG